MRLGWLRALYKYHEGVYWTTLGEWESAHRVEMAYLSSSCKIHKWCLRDSPPKVEYFKFASKIVVNRRKAKKTQKKTKTKIVVLYKSFCSRQTFVINDKHICCKIHKIVGTLGWTRRSTWSTHKKERAVHVPRPIVFSFLFFIFYPLGEYEPRVLAETFGS